MRVTEISILRLVLDSWRDSLRAIEDVGVLIAVVATILLGLNYVGAPNELDSSSAAYPMLWALSLFLGQALVLSGLAISVHRTLLLGKTDVRLLADYRQYLRFYGYVVFFLGLCQVPLVLLDFDLSNQTVTWRTGIAILLSIGTLALLARMLIFFPALAIHAPGARIGKAFRDSQGHGRRILLILICTLMPLVAVGGMALRFLENVRLGSFGEFFALETRALGTAMATTVVAATASRLYRHYADSLGRPADDLTVTGSVRAKDVKFR
jgi:hypothetical protein